MATDTELEASSGSQRRTAASYQYATFTLCGHTYGIEVSRVQEVLRTQERTRVPLAPKAVMGLINLRGQILMAIDLRRQLLLPERTPEDDEPMVIVVNAHEEATALLVDEIGGVVSVSEGSFETPPDTLTTSRRHLLRGAYKLPDELLLALEVDQAVLVQCTNPA